MKKIRPKIIAIDFDDTIAENSFPDITNAKLKDYAKEMINKLYDEDYYIIIWTCRYLPNHIQDCKDFLKKNEINYHAINQNYPGLEFKPSPKIYYDYLVDDKTTFQIDWLEEYQKIQTLFSETDLYDITVEMKDHFYTRTRKHIEATQLFYVKYYQKTNIDFDDKIWLHDFIKFSKEEIAPYIAITWNYLCKDLDIPFDIPQSVKDAMNKATEHHVRNSPHHPEYWSDRKDDLIPKGDRDKFDPLSVPTIDVSLTMPKDAIIEMCADWCAMSQERMNTPYEWAEKVIDKRWKFGKEKTEFIYDVLKIMWGK